MQHLTKRDTLRCSSGTRRQTVSVMTSEEGESQRITVSSYRSSQKISRLGIRENRHFWAMCCIHTSASQSAALQNSFSSPIFFVFFPKICLLRVGCMSLKPMCSSGSARRQTAGWLRGQHRLPLLHQCRCSPVLFTSGGQSSDQQTGVKVLGTLLRFLHQ